MLQDNIYFLQHHQILSFAQHALLGSIVRLEVLIVVPIVPAVYTQLVGPLRAWHALEVNTPMEVVCVQVVLEVNIPLQE